ncbi:MAG TPA: hypothetical protein EYP49_01210 [Anaerolineae bacterium]|nr:hypothetical protein [Anaerolineae bacterium]
MLVRRSVATAIAISVGLFVLLDFFVQNAFIGLVKFVFVRWAIIITAFAMILGFFNVLIVHLNKILRFKQGWFYSIFLILTMMVVLTLGLAEGPQGPLTSRIFQYVLFPLQATIFSLLAFFVASAAYRAFRLRSWESALLVITGLIVLLGQVPLWGALTTLKEHILEVPVMAGTRGILLGVALGTVATGLRVLLGIDRPYSE